MGYTTGIGSQRSRKLVVFTSDLIDDFLNFSFLAVFVLDVGVCERVSQ